jgi:hypothetical protein
MGLTLIFSGKKNLDAQVHNGALSLFQLIFTSPPLEQFSGTKKNITNI